MRLQECNGCGISMKIGKKKRATGLCVDCCQKRYTIEIRVKRQALKKSISDIGCLVCDEDHYACLEVHHLHSKYKRFGRSQDIVYNIEDIEMGHAVVLCANCHNLFHASFGGKNKAFPEMTKEETIVQILNFRETGGHH